MQIILAETKKFGIFHNIDEFGLKVFFMPINLIFIDLYSHKLPLVGFEPTCFSASTFEVDMSTIPS